MGAGPVLPHGRGVPVRIEKRLPPGVNISAVVGSSTGMDRFYFKDRRNRYETGAIGCVRVYGSESDSAFPIEQADRLWEEDPRFTLFGGMRFFDEPPPPEWDSFGSIRFVLPLLELYGEENVCRIVLNAFPSESASQPGFAEELIETLRHIDAMPPSVQDKGIPSFTETLVPGRQKWQVLVDEALGWLRENGARKVVLARKKILNSTALWDSVALFHCLDQIQEDAFLFSCWQKNGDAFMGRSPERLFRMGKGFLASDAIAGTRRRGEDPEDDARLSAELMASVKDVLEHRFVADYIRAQLAFLCKDVTVEASASPLKLRHLQHIITRVSGRVSNGHAPFDILSRLHPTPAVGGMPPKLSRELIMRLEPFGRGWFGAPIGWMRKDAAEFAVGIRSALVRGTELHLFGGAGIVTGSDAEMEWQETGHKMENFIRILQGC
ncbi:MAG: isochorismate synthase [Desulfosalsimonadaceae bacterium]